MDMTFTIKPTGAALGAEIHGLDLTRPISEAEKAGLREALLRHVLLVFPGQHLTAGQLADFCRCFGPITRHILDQFHHPEEHEMCIISNVVESGKGRTTARTAGSYWHSDLSYLAEPAETSMLYAIEVPETGGDTLFCNMYTAYEALSDRMKAYLEGLTAKHDGVSQFGEGTPDAVHPVIVRHPESGRKLIYVNDAFTTRINEVSQEESAAILKFLCDHCSRPEWSTRFRWEPHSIAFWDNRCIQHRATSDYLPNVRSGFRVQIEGTAAPVAG